MAKHKTKTFFLCRQCGSMHAKWLGKCPDCGTWDSLEETVKASDDPHRPRALSAGAMLPSTARSVAAPEGEETGDGPARRMPLAGVELGESVPIAIADVPPLEVPRISTRISELDRVLGGGIVPGSAILLGGEPGIGKSTLLLQALACLSHGGARDGGKKPAPATGQNVLYVTSEESAQQTQLRARRLGFGESRLQVLAETNMERITGFIGRLRPAIAVIDSVQMIYNPANPSAPGSVSQLRDCCTELVYLAKATGTAVCLVGHVTKEGILAGPKLIEHIVDTVLYFEGDSHQDYRIVRAAKNRFGATLEIGLFRMTGAGLESVEDAGTLLLEPHDVGDAKGGARTAGSIITAALQGSRVLMVEVQALTADAMLGGAKRKVSGADASRVAMIIAVLEKHAGLRLVDKDVFVNVVGGIKLSDPSADAAIALAIAGAHMNRPLPPSTLVLGELGLLGEFRSVTQIQQRLSEAQRLGFTRAVVPARTKSPAAAASMQRHLCRNIDQAIELLG